MDIQDQSTKTTIRYSIRITELSAKLFARAATALLNHISSREKTGNVKLKTFVKKSGDRLLSEELKSGDLKLLSQIAKKYQVSFAAMKSNESNNYTIFFQSKNEALLKAVLNQYLAENLKREQQPKKEPLCGKLHRAAEIVKSMNQNEPQTRHKEHIR